MILIGERLNAMFTDVKEAVKNRDKAVLQDLAKRQTEAGADYLDVSVGTSANPEDVMQWMVESIQETCDTPLTIDSQRPNVIAAGLKCIDTSKDVMLNSTPLDKKTDEEVLNKYIEMAAPFGGKLVALTMNKEGVPQNLEKRVEIAAGIVEKAMEAGFPTENLFIDPIILPINVPNAQTQPGFILEAIAQIQMLSEPAPHMTIGLSNVSQGTTERPLLNRIFCVMAMAAGMDSAILDVFDEELVRSVAAADVLMNKQIYSDSFVKAFLSLKH
jgi:5-methyltetrahydrofolate corrinoid/iron sulfur protein methyltransferase